MKHRAAVVMGTRPEGIKLAPVVAALRAADDFQTVVVSTGQHRELLRHVVDLFGIAVDHDLDVMRPNQTLAELTARLLTELDAALETIRPDIVLAQGDTTSVLCAALACYYRRIPVGHVEAGLRTGNLAAPFPEEVNRKLTGSLATLHFAPTEFGKRNLLAEGVDPRRIFVTGNTVIDALMMEQHRQENPAVRSTIHAKLAALLGEAWNTTPYVLVTGHRRESFGAGFQQIYDALATLARRFPDHRFVYPVHLNPNVHGPVHERLGGLPNIRLIEPQSYGEFVALMAGCTLALTDSGGVQEEAPSLGKPVLVMRDTTERPEGVEAGTALLVGTDARPIVAHVARLLTDPIAYRSMSEAKNPYGDGQAAPRIVEAIRGYLAEHPTTA